MVKENSVKWKTASLSGCRDKQSFYRQLGERNGEASERVVPSILVVEDSSFGMYMALADTCMAPNAFVLGLYPLQHIYDALLAPFCNPVLISRLPNSFQ